MFFLSMNGVFASGPLNISLSEDEDIKCQDQAARQKRCGRISVPCCAIAARARAFFGCSCCHCCRWRPPGEAGLRTAFNSYPTFCRMCPNTSWRMILYFCLRNLWFYLGLFHMLHSYDITWTWGDDANASSQVQDPWGFAAAGCILGQKQWESHMLTSLLHSRSTNRWKHQPRAVEHSGTKSAGLLFMRITPAPALIDGLRRRFWGRKQLNGWNCLCQAAPSEPFLDVSSRGSDRGHLDREQATWGATALIGFVWTWGPQSSHFAGEDDDRSSNMEMHHSQTNCFLLYIYIWLPRL